MIASGFLEAAAPAEEFRKLERASLLGARRVMSDRLPSNVTRLGWVPRRPMLVNMLFCESGLNMGVLLISELKVLFCEARTSVILCAEAAAARARGRKFLNCIVD